MKVAGSAPGNAAATVVLKFLAAGGLKADDINQVYMNFPQMVIALQNKAIDAALPAEPSVSEALRTGAVVAVANDFDVYPVHQISELLYSGKFATRDPDLARRFMRAFLRGVRFENDALGPDGAFVGSKGDQVVSILAEYGPFKDPAVWRSFILSACDPNGALHVASIQEDLDIFREQGLLEGKLDLARVIDTSFTDWAVGQLGPYAKK
jgi:NitT/TauT family transport system substrate-binding protein